MSTFLSSGGMKLSGKGFSVIAPMNCPHCGSGGGSFVSKADVVSATFSCGFGIEATEAGTKTFECRYAVGDET